MEKHKVMYSKREIWFNLEFKEVKNFNISVKPDLSVHVSAPLYADLDKVYDFVKSKASWVIRNINSFTETKSLEVNEREYVNGETHKYLGRQYRLVIEQAYTKEFVTMKPGYITINVKKKENTRRKQNLLNEWMKARANIVFREALDSIYPVIASDVIPKPEIEIKTMKKRWGSCLRSKNRIILNYELIKAPKHCIEYVALHELVHFIHRNHDQKFYSMLTVLMPDWKQRKAILDEEIVLFV